MMLVTLQLIPLIMLSVVMTLKSLSTMPRSNVRGLLPRLPAMLIAILMSVAFISSYMKTMLVNLSLRLLQHSL